MSNIQTILIPKHFTIQQAKNWLYDHGYKFNKIDDDVHFYRFRQRPPTNGHYYTITLSNGIHLVYSN
jgi:hypothetical protein